MATLLEQIRRAYLVSTPLVSIATPDPSGPVDAVTREVVDVQAKNGKHGVMLQWDAVRGMTSATDENVVGDLNSLSDNNPDVLRNPVEMLSRIVRIEKGSVVFIHNAHLLIAPDGKPTIDIVQGIQNIRDHFKRDQRMLVLLSPGMTMPRELVHDVMTYEESLPDADALAMIVRSVYEAGHDDKDPSATLTAKSVEALQGLSAFTAEQVTAMSLTKDGIDLDGLWDRKKAMIDSTPGLTIWKPTTTLDDIIGSDNCNAYLDRFLKKQDVNLVVWIDEIEKQLHGAEGESNGIVMDQVNVLLQEMETNNYHGMVFLGPPGTGKSMTAQSTGTLTCQLDFGGLLDSLVGESQSRMRQAMQIIHAVSGGKVLFLATCNSTAGLSPALMRRFKSGKFFFDLPNAEAKTALWRHYVTRYGYSGNVVLDVSNNMPASLLDDGWSPANIHVCVETATSMGYTFHEAAEYIVAEGKASARSIEALRSQAEGVWISASEMGKVERPKVTAKGQRHIDPAHLNFSDADKVN